MPSETDSRRQVDEEAGVKSSYYDRTRFALARALVLRRQNTDVSLRICRTSLTRCLGRLVLIEISETIATDATELADVGLKVT